MPAGQMFPTTQWSLVARAHGEDTVTSKQALDALIHLYRPALLKYLCFVAQLELHQAEDMLQGFLEQKILRQQLIAHADHRRGRFRTYLKTVLQHYVNSEFRKIKAQKRAADYAQPVSDADMDRLSQANPSQQPNHFEIEWARTLLQEAIERFRQECIAMDRHDLWKILAARVINPILHDTPAERYEDLIARMGFSSPSQVVNALNKAKSMLSDQIKTMVAAYARDETELEEEINELFKILSCR